MTWTPAEDARLRELVAGGASVGVVAKEFGRARSTVHDRAKRLGLSFDRSHANPGTESAVQDVRARRAALARMELEIMERAARLHLDGLNGIGWQTLVRGSHGAENTETLNFIPARDAAHAAQARNTSAAIIAKLDDRATEHDEARSVVTRLVDALAVAVEAEDTQDAQ